MHALLPEHPLQFTRNGVLFRSILSSALQNFVRDALVKK